MWGCGYHPPFWFGLFDKQEEGVTGLRWRGRGSPSSMTEKGGISSYLLPTIRGMSRPTCIKTRTSHCRRKPCSGEEPGSNIDHSPMFITCAMYNQELDYNQAAAWLISSQRKLRRLRKGPACSFSRGNPTVERCDPIQEMFPRILSLLLQETKEVSFSAKVHSAAEFWGNALSCARLFVWMYQLRQVTILLYFPSCVFKGCPGKLLQRLCHYTGLLLAGGCRHQLHRRV